MAAHEPVTLYTAKVCPFCQRVELALEELGAKYTPYTIELGNKPSWYPAVEPNQKVPALVYGPNPDPTNPPPESIRLFESLILVDFVSDLYPESSAVWPKDPVKRAKIRLFIETVGSKLVPAWAKFTIRGSETPESVIQAVEAVQALLPDDGGFFLGGDEFSAADIAVAPFFARLNVSMNHDVGAFKAGEGKKIYEVLYKDEKFAKFRTYFAKVQQRESYKKTLDEAHIIDDYTKRRSS